MELARYKACICEGSVENAIMDILLDHNLLIFSREEMIGDAIMAKSTFSVQMEDQLKEQFSELCEAYGMNMSTAINIFARAVVRERRIPFEISQEKSEITREGALATFNAIRSKAIEDGLADMSLEEINAEIDAVLRGK